MSRERFPSDDRRLKVPPHVRVYQSIRHPDDVDQAKVFADPMFRGIWLGTVLTAARARAGDTEDRFLVQPADLEWITGRNNHAARVLWFGRVCELMGWELEVLAPGGREAGAKLAGGRVQSRAGLGPACPLVVHVRNLSGNQGWDSAKRGALRTRTRDQRADLKNPEPTAERGAGVFEGGEQNPKPPTLRDVKLADFHDRARFEALRRQAIEAGLLADTQRGKIEWYTRRVHALDYAAKQEAKGIKCCPVRVFIGNLRKRVDYSTTSHEDVAVDQLRDLEAGERADAAEQLELVLGRSLDDLVKGAL